MSTEQRAHTKHISTQLRGLYAELTSIEERALPIVEELDNWELENGFKFPWSPEVKAKFVAMRKLITRV